MGVNKIETYKIATYYGLEYKVYKDGTIIGPKRGVVKQKENKDGYMEVTLGKTDNRHARVKVHRIIAEQFIDNPLGLPEVNHIDCNRKNNSADNLEWCTHLQNIRHSTNLGHYKNKCGSNNGRSRLNWDIVESIRSDYKSGKKISEISYEYNIPWSTVSNVVHKKTWNM